MTTAGWKVIIADDEPIIREGIHNSVNWEALGMAVVAQAEDGEEALELAVRHGVHILLVDLNMPIMDGLTLVKHIRDQVPDCKVIIISGHDEFSYAQEAIRLNVDDYILKPANPEQLRKVLERVKLELETTLEQNELLKSASRQISKNFPLLRERFCTEWVQGTLTQGEIEEQLSFLKLPSARPAQLCIVRWPETSSNRPLLKENDRQLFLFAIENIISELLQPYPRVTFRDDSGLIVTIVWDSVPESVFSDIAGSIQVYLKIPIHLQVEPMEGPITEIAEVYRICKSKLYKESDVSPLVKRAKWHIAEQYSDPDLTLESTARLLQVSPVYLSRIFKQELGTSFVSLVTQTRIKKAVQLLNSTDMTIHDIAGKVGYETQHYFSTAFKKAMGIPPNQYRKGGSSS